MQMAQDFFSPITALHSLLEERRKKNRQYSLRAFARFLGVSPTTLSLIFQGKRPLSLKLALRVATKCNLSPGEKRKLLSSIVESTFQGENPPSLNTASFLELQKDSFWLISEWYYYAILALGDFSTNSLHSRWIASRLGISPREARAAIQKLLHYGYIRRRGNGFTQATPPFFISRAPTASIVKDYFRRNLKLAENTLDEVPVSERFFHTFTMAVDSRELARAEKIIEKFRDDLAAVLEKGNRDRVYTLAVQLFPTSKKNTSS